MNPTVHLFDSTGDAYDASQTRDDIRDGDVLAVYSERVVGVLVKAWPTAVSDEHGAFHTLDENVEWSCVGKRDAKTITIPICPPDAEPFEQEETFPADPGTDYSESEREARDVLAYWQHEEHEYKTDPAISDEERALVASYEAQHSGDGDDLSRMFPRYSRVSVRHPFGTREIASGEIVGYVLGFYDHGSPESGPGPVERETLLRVVCDDGKVRNVYPGDADNA